MYDISKARNRQAAGARCNKTVTLRRLCYRGPLRGPAPPKRGSFLIYYHEAAQGCTRGCNLGRELGAGAFSVSPQGRALRPASGISCGWDGGRRTPHPPRLAPTPSPQGEGFGAAGSLREILGLCAGGGLVPRLSLACSVTGTGEGGPLIRHGSRRHTFPPVGGRLWGGWKPAGDFGPLRRGGACPPPVSGMFCDWYGGGGPSSAAARAATPSPVGGRLWGGWKPAGDFGPLRGRGLPRLSLACSVTGTGGGAPLRRLRTPSPTGGRLFGAAGSRPA